MTIRRITYSSPIDALVRSLAAIEWAGDYQHYMDLKREIEQKLSAVA